MIFDPTKNHQIYDISPVVSRESAVFPGDTPFQTENLLHYEKGHKLMLSSFKTTCHMGAHADAPLHYGSEGKSIDEQDLSVYLGLAQVIDVSLYPKGRLPLSLLEEKKIKAGRVLLKTNSLESFDEWQDEFTSLSPELVDGLAKRQVFLIGLDTPSVDPSKDAELLSHNRCFIHEISLLENLDLRGVKEGFYNLVALPLKLKGLEASPVRALLIG